MIAEEIRNSSVTEGVRADQAPAKWLQEIAAQLADLNEKMAVLIAIVTKGVKDA